MAKDGSMMPQSTAGLIRYYEATKDSITMKPEHVAFMCVAIIVGELAIKFIL